MDIKISKEKMLEMAQKLAKMDFCPEQKVFYKNVLELLKADAEGRLVVLSCRIGDTVYTNTSMTGWYFRDSAKPYAAKVVFIGLNNSGGIINVEFSRGHMMQFRFDEVGKTIFLTHEEAEAALEKMGGGDE